jgi:hypothetical protein
MTVTQLTYLALFLNLVNDESAPQGPLDGNRNIYFVERFFASNFVVCDLF